MTMLLLSLLLLLVVVVVVVIILIIVITTTTIIIIVNTIILVIVIVITIVTVSSLRSGHADLLCTVLILMDDPRGEPKIAFMIANLKIATLYHRDSH